LPNEIDVIGLFIFGAIGDTILASAVVQDIRAAYPKSRILGFVSFANAGAAELLEGFDELVVVPITRPFAAVRLIRRYKMDVVVDFGPWPRISALIAAFSRTRFAIGFRTEGQFRHAAFDQTAQHMSTKHEIDNFRALVDCLGVSGRSLPRLKGDLLAECSVPRTESYVVFHPWASGYRSELREWAEDNWVALAHSMLQLGYRIAITGGPADAARAQELARLVGDSSNIRVTAGRAKLRETVVVLANAAAVVSVNTGVMHLAALLNKPMLALHGPTNPKRWGPLSDAAVVIGPGAEEGCAFLNLGFEYPRNPPDCMSKITVAEVDFRLRQLLKIDPKTS
jgi:ADP-heptose:LPS heptosyltransferase